VGSHDLNRLLDEPGQAKAACPIYSENIFLHFIASELNWAEPTRA